MSPRLADVYESFGRGLKWLTARTGRYLGDQPAGDDDPLECLIGLVQDASGPDDVAENHDHYLYGAPKERP